MTGPEPGWTRPVLGFTYVAGGAAGGGQGRGAGRRGRGGVGEARPGPGWARPGPGFTYGGGGAAEMCTRKRPWTGAPEAVRARALPPRPAAERKGTACSPGVAGITGRDGEG